MDKNAIKKYAVWARRELIEKVSQKALQYGIEDGKELDPKLDSINGVLLTDDEKKQRQALIRKINENGYTQVMEEVAYTWFNRFIALRFMEVNGYLPSHVRVFTDEAGEFKPQIMSEALHLELKGIDTEKVYELKNSNKDDDLFKYLLITQCNDLSDIFPKMFQKIADYTELLLPDYLLREGSVIEQMVNQKDGIPEADWQDQVQIIGWLYQYYNTEPKDKVFADLKKNVKITKETIPAATQLFTPDWIVHYMVENSLGRLWLEGHPNDTLKEEWKYYLDEAEQEPDVQKQLETIRKEYAGLKPEEIRCIDPCMGSGHILCVLFDTLIKIYEDYGYPARDAAASIVENNLWGLDIDERAAQLAYFAVMMKARQYDRRFLTRGIQPHVYAIEESNGLNYDGDYADFLLDKSQQETLSYMFEVFKDAKEYGSILNVEQKDYDAFLNAWKMTAEQTLSDVRMMGWYMYAGDRIFTLANQAKALSQKYHVVVTNPPYMGGRNMNSNLLNRIVKDFPEGKADLFSAFILRTMDMTAVHGYQAMITMHSWMFLSSFEQLRNKISQNSFVIMAHLGARAFEEISGEVVQTTSWVLRKAIIQEEYRAKFVRLLNYGSQIEKEMAYLENTAPVYCVEQKQMSMIPGKAFGYWLDNPDVFSQGSLLEQVANPRQGLKTLDNDYYIRYWYEVDFTKMKLDSVDSEDALNSRKKWFPLNHGGEFRKYYGNNYTVVNWENDGEEMKANAVKKYNSITRTITNIGYYFKEGITWSVLCSEPSFRWYEKGYIFSNGGQCIVPDGSVDLHYLVGLLNSKISGYLLNMLSPTMGFESGYLKKLPIIISQEEAPEVARLSEENIRLSKEEWDDYEVSWGFIKHPLISQRGSIKDNYNLWSEKCKSRFEKIKNNEEKLNEVFIRIYGFDKSLTPEVTNDNVSVRLSDLKRDIKSLISYAVGCMFGRYSVDVPGLAYAGGSWDASKYKSFVPDEDAIIPICDDEYFEDDIVGCFITFLKNVYGTDTLEENLQYIADSLGGKGLAREVIRNYFINEFYTDHLKIYQKCPIYWLFDSGKKNGFKCLIYIHRYRPDTIARIRTDYVHEQQARYRTEIEEIEKRIESVSSSEKIKLSKKLNQLKGQDDEIHLFEEKIHHLADQMITIDLDAGVKKNYERFKDVLAKL